MQYGTSVWFWFCVCSQKCACIYFVVYTVLCVVVTGGAPTQACPSVQPFLLKQDKIISIQFNSIQNTAPHAPSCPPPRFHTSQLVHKCSELADSSLAQPDSRQKICLHETKLTERLARDVITARWSANHLNCTTPSYRYAARDAAVFGRCDSCCREASQMCPEVS